MKQIAYLIMIVVLITISITCVSGAINRNSTPDTPTIGECNDGIDNDGDGLTDWQYDPGCTNQNDNDEAASSRDGEDGFTTFDKGTDSIIVYVSSSVGNDGNTGSSPQLAVKTLARASTLVRDGHNDFMLLRRGDTWRGENLGRFKSGLDKNHPLVISSYGESTERPRLEVNGQFIDHDGHSRSYVSITGLQIVSYPKIPGDRNFDGATGGGFRFVGGGKGLLIEDCHILYGELIVQSHGVYHYEDVEIRRNIIEYNYHVGTSGQNPAYRPSGMYSSHVTGLTIEGNIFDHNGWNEKVNTAGATMYNHNMYLNARNLEVRDNIITRASSMGIKMRSDTAGEVSDLLFENNLISDGEIGISIGGNTNEINRFSNVTIRRNVFNQIGKSNPTERNFSWMLDVKDNKNTVIENNHFLHQPWYTNAYAIQIGGASAAGISVKGNLFYDLKQCSIYINAADAWSEIVISGNTLIDATHNSSLVNHNGSFKNVTYHNNRYRSSAGNQWFSVNGKRQSLLQWVAASGETGALAWTGTFNDPNRTIGSYAATLGLQNTLDGFLAAAKKQNRLNWRRDLTAGAVNEYIRAGFN